MSYAGPLRSTGFQGLAPFIERTFGNGQLNTRNLNLLISRSNSSSTISWKARRSPIQHAACGNAQTGNDDPFCLPEHRISGDRVRNDIAAVLRFQEALARIWVRRVEGASLASRAKRCRSLRSAVQVAATPDWYCSSASGLGVTHHIPSGPDIGTCCSC